MKPHFWMVLFGITLVLGAGCGKKNEIAVQVMPGEDQPDGKAIYEQRCAACHDRGLAGAPQNGNKADWNEAITGGIDRMIERSINGYRGQRGLMPPRGGHPGLSDTEVAAAVQYLSQQNR